MTKIDKLIEGYKDFYKENFALEENNIFKNLKLSQSPKTLIISCSDSRINPTVLTNARAGDIFSIRNVANLVPPYQPEWNSCHGTSAAIEFAVNHLKVEHIIVMGHSDCGGIKTLVENDVDINQEFSFITDWMKIIKNIKKNIPKNLTQEEKYTFCEQEGIKTSLENLKTFPWIKERINNKMLEIHGWYFSIKDGSLLSLNVKTDSFEKL